MKFLSLTLVLFLFSLQLSFSQDCKAYIPYEEGTVLETYNYDKKDKLTGITINEVLKVTNEGAATIYELKQVTTDDKGKNPVEAVLEFKCENGVFYVDLNAILSPETMSAYEDIEMEMEMTAMELPADMKPGQQLKDGEIKMTMVSESPIDMSMTIKITNRKVTAKETIKTPAGSFECYKLEEDIETKSMYTMVISTVSWYVEGIGAVRSESYKKGKLMAYTVLNSITKP